MFTRQIYRPTAVAIHVSLCPDTAPYRGVSGAEDNVTANLEQVVDSYEMKIFDKVTAESQKSQQKTISMQDAPDPVSGRHERHYSDQGRVVNARKDTQPLHPVANIGPGVV